MADAHDYAVRLAACEMDPVEVPRRSPAEYSVVTVILAVCYSCMYTGA